MHHDARHATAIQVPESCITPRLAKTRSNFDDQQRDRERADNWQRLATQIGPRYANLRLADFRCYREPEIAQLQRKIVESIQQYADDIATRCARGDSIILYGPPGTGKDHLLIPLMRAAIGHYLHVEWRNGMELWRDLRDTIGSDSKERDFMRPLTSADVLMVSDPIPPRDSLTEFQSATFIQLIDRRYRDQKPTWLTMNIASASEARERVGGQVISRLRDSGLCLFCNWPDYRERRQKKIVGVHAS